MNPAWVAAITAVVVAVLTGAAWGGRLAWRLLRDTYRFLQDWGGMPARNGLEDTPGVMARLKAVEELVTKVAGEVAKVVTETRPNGGSSLHDAVTRTEQAVEVLLVDQQAMRNRMELFESNRVCSKGSKPGKGSKGDP